MPDSNAVLAVPPTVYRFSAKAGSPGEDDLRKVLRQQSNTVPMPIKQANDLLLDSDGMVQGRYRLTEPALASLCDTLAPGLLRAAHSLAGVHRRSKRFPNEGYSIGKAIALVNYMIKARFNLLARYRLIVDRSSAQVEGIVGPKYHFLSNLEMYERVAAYLQSHAREPVVFQEAALAGRRLQLRYRIVERAFALETPGGRMEPFYGGWHYANSELADCCVKGSCVLLRESAGTTSLAPYDQGSRLMHVHQGGKFDQKLFAVLENLSRRTVKIPNLAPCIRQAMRAPLRFGDSAESYNKRAQAIASQLVKKGGLFSAAAKDAVAMAAIYGSFRDDAVPGAAKTVNWQLPVIPVVYTYVSRRVVYDLYNATTYLARRYSLEHQEVSEQAAYRLLIGQLEI